MPSDEKPYYTVVLKANYKEQTIKDSRRVTQSYEYHQKLRGSKIAFEEKFLKLEAKETWGGECGMEKGERDYTFWIPYNSILYIKYAERKAVD